jgi:hypothetical protein
MAPAYINPRLISLSTWYVDPIFCRNRSMAGSLASTDTISGEWIWATVTPAKSFTASGTGFALSRLSRRVVIKNLGMGTSGLGI